MTPYDVTQVRCSKYKKKMNQNTNNVEFDLPNFLNFPIIFIKNSRHREEIIFSGFRVCEFHVNYNSDSMGNMKHYIVRVAMSSPILKLLMSIEDNVLLWFQGVRLSYPIYFTDCFYSLCLFVI